MSRFWLPDDLVRVRAAVRAAAGGTPTTVVVEGGPGSGKSSLLEELVAQAEGFAVLSAVGVPAETAPFGLLGQWGLGVDRASGGGLRSPFLVAQELRVALDARRGRGPALLVVDDLHWADRESTEALSWLLRRASGDPLLLAAGTRPLQQGQHPAWQRWLAGESAAVRVRLSGLGASEAVALVRERRPEVPEGAARRLWEHTSGNPLYLLALLAEQDTAALLAPGALPAPAGFARSTAARLDVLPEPAAQLARALAVLGAGWHSAVLAAAVAGVQDPQPVAQALVDADLAQWRGPEHGDQVRLSHALISAAVAQQVRSPLLRALHRAAAGALDDEPAVLQHRVAATDGTDAALAEELADAASAAYAARSYRLAAQYLRWASSLSADPAAQAARRTEALYVSVLGREVLDSAALAALEASPDPHGRALVLGTLAVVQQRWSDAVGVLAPAVERLGPDDDVLLRYRLEALLAWSRVATGAPGLQVLAGLGRLHALGVRDVGVGAYADLAGGQAVLRVDDMYDALQGLTDLATAPAAIPLEQTYVLAFRGSVLFQCGLLSAAIVDLSEARRRVETGMLDVTDGGLHAFLGYAQWFHGQWDLAALNTRLAEEIADGQLLPLAQCWRLVLPAAAGRFDEADAQAEELAASLEPAPWTVAVQSLVVARVVRLHAGGDAVAQAQLWDEVSRRFPTTSMTEGVLGPLFLLHLALAALWGDRPEEVHAYTAQMLGVRLQAEWVPSAVAWLHGLQAEARFDGDAALSQLRTAVAFPADDLPLYRAHVLHDHARLASERGLNQEAEASRSEALELYRALGAQPYLDRLQPAATRQVLSADSGLGVTDRERDILALVLQGLSYAQIAADLFITQSTVSYHLGNLYAKADVKSRHQLAAAARSDPAAFGLAPATV